MCSLSPRTRRMIEIIRGKHANVMTGEWARHTLRILQFQVLYGNIPEVQIPIPHPHHTRRPKLHSRTKLKQQRSNKNNNNQRSMQSIKLYTTRPSSVHGAERASSQQSKNSDRFHNTIDRQDTSPPRQTLRKDTCISRRNTIQIMTL